jgi:hypothetical protein
MAGFSRSSFIPKETSAAIPNRVRRRRTFHVFSFISTAVLIGSLALAAGVFFLKRSSATSLIEAQQALIDQKNLFKQESINEVRGFARRLQAAELLIQNHISPLWFFSELEKDTMQKVQFSSIGFEHTPAFEVLVTLTGVTPEFKTLALQEIQFSLNSILKGITFSQVATNEGSASKEGDEDDTETTSGVTFSLEGTFEPSSILYDGSTHSSGLTLSTALFQSAVLGESITSE